MEGESNTARPATNVRNSSFTLGLGPAGTTFSQPSIRLAKEGEPPKSVKTVKKTANAVMVAATKMTPVVRDTSAAPSNSPNSSSHGAARAANASSVMPS